MSRFTACILSHSQGEITMALALSARQKWASSLLVDGKVTWGLSSFTSGTKQLTDVVPGHRQGRPRNNSSPRTLKRLPVLNWGFPCRAGMWANIHPATWPGIHPQWGLMVEESAHSALSWPRFRSLWVGTALWCSFYSCASGGGGIRVRTQRNKASKVLSAQHGITHEMHKVLLLLLL